MRLSSLSVARAVCRRDGAMLRLMADKAINDDVAILRRMSEGSRDV